MATELMHEGFRAREHETTMGIAAGGSIAEAIGGVGVVVLAILGLVGLLPEEFAAIATMAVGVALLLEGIAIATRFSDVLSESGRGLSEEIKLGGGMGAEFIGGAAGGVLGLLALLGIVPVTLMAVAVIVFGASLLLSSFATCRLDLLASRLSQNRLTGRWMVAGIAASGVQVLVGIAGIALGIIALVGISPMILILAGLLSAGVAVLISGSAVSGSIASVMQH